MPDPLCTERRAIEDRAVLARALTTVECGGDAAAELMRSARDRARPSLDPAVVLGITGPPGVGKSCLTGLLVGEARRAGHQVGVLAVDPSSPVSGGALLADRVRMAGHAADAGVFIRSIASRGQPGGLAPAVADAAELMELAGYQTVLIETVGVGQDAVGLADVADATVLVVMPELGDELQAAKAGLAEMADVIVVNKADLPGAAAAVRQLRTMVALRAADRKRPQVLSASAASGAGVAELWQAATAIAGTRGPERNARRDHARAARAIDAALLELRTALLQRRAGPAALLDEIAAGRESPAGLAAWLLSVTAGRDQAGTR
jgi:LAO/AO transport system kinase